MIFSIFAKLIFVSLFIQEISGQSQIFKQEKNKEVLNNTGMIESFAINTRLKCLNKCRKNLDCSMITFYNGICRLFDNEPMKQFIYSNESDVFIKDFNGSCILNKCLKSDPKFISMTYNGEMNAICVLSNGDLVTASYTNGITRIWDTINYRIKRNTTWSTGIRFYSILEIAPGVICFGASNGSIIIMNGTNLIKSFSAASGIIKSVLLYGDDKLITASADTFLKVWNITDYSLIASYKIHSNAVNELIRLKNGDFASASVDRSIGIWNGKNFSLIKNMLYPSSQVETVAELLNEDIVSGGSDLKVVIWDRKSFMVKKTLTTSGITYSIKSYWNGNFAAGNNDGTVIVWNTEGNQIRSFKNLSKPIYRLIFLQNGDLAASFLVNSTFIIWDKSMLS